MKNRLFLKTNCQKGFLQILLILISFNVFSQNQLTVNGHILDFESHQPIPYASVQLDQAGLPGGSLSRGGITNEQGAFVFGQLSAGKFKLRIHALGYQNFVRTIEINKSGELAGGIVYLKDSTISISETVITSSRLKGKSLSGKAIYFTNKALVSASGNAPDLLRHLPGVEVDLKQDISIDGNSDILLFVDGKERDKSYISQLDPSSIDRVEVLNTPPAQYEGSVSGVINIILKKEKNSGFSGHAFSEIPLNQSVTYLFPTWGLNYTHNQFNFFISYNGEINVENLIEKTQRELMVNDSSRSLLSVQNVKQRHYTHKFHFGMDYNLTRKDLLSLYGFYSFYSYEQDGAAALWENTEQSWTATKDETDHNHNRMGSFFFCHQFKHLNQQITIDFSQAAIRSSNKVIYTSTSNGYLNSEKPEENRTNLNIDFQTPFSEYLQMNGGVKLTSQAMHEDDSEDFNYHQRIYAVYSSFYYKFGKWELTAATRIEDAEIRLNDNDSYSMFSVLPYGALHYQLNEHSDVSVNYRRSIKRPSVYSLNPYSYTDDPYTMRIGNSVLDPELINRLQFEYVPKFKVNHFAFRLFWQRRSNAINDLVLLDSNQIFVSQPQNLGRICEYGTQLIGAIKWGIVSFNSSVRFYQQHIQGNVTALTNGIHSKYHRVAETDLSVVFSLKKQTSLSLLMQYATSKETLQESRFSDLLYFVAVDKTIKKNLKIGVVSALPLINNFTYQGTAIHNDSFSLNYKGVLKLPQFPLMLRFSYRFTTGKSRKVLKREKDNLDIRPKQGF